MNEPEEKKTTEGQRKASEKWKEKNTEKVKEYAKLYYQKNKETILAKTKEDYRVKNLEKNTQRLLKLINPKVLI
jgi:hypothetical protein